MRGIPEVKILHWLKNETLWAQSLLAILILTVTRVLRNQYQIEGLSRQVLLAVLLAGGTLWLLRLAIRPKGRTFSRFQVFAFFWGMAVWLIGLGFLMTASSGPALLLFLLASPVFGRR